MTRFYIVDDDADYIRLAEAFLVEAGHEVGATTCSELAEERIRRFQPDCVIVDLMMPQLDGLSLCQRIKSHSPQTKVVIVSAKSYQSDRAQALRAGADGYLTKPIQRRGFVRQLEKLVADEVEIAFWGTRGTLPVPGPETVRYGGNTSCVSAQFNQAGLFIFDAGSGIRLLSDYLMARGGCKQGKILISHTHTDHINTLPFFAPLFEPGNDFAIMGGAPPNLSLHDIFATQMRSEYFPITLDEFGAHVHFEEISEGTAELDGVTLRTMLLNHPGVCLGYRLEYKGVSVCYVTDNELFPKDDPRHSAAYVRNLTQFVESSDLLITDCTYTDAEYPSKIGWGHSCVREVTALAAAANVKSLCLHHHDIGQTDDDIDRKLEDAREQLRRLGASTECFAPAEGNRIGLKAAEEPVAV